MPPKASSLEVARDPAKPKRKRDDETPQGSDTDDSDNPRSNGPEEPSTPSTQPKQPKKIRQEEAPFPATDDRVDEEIPDALALVREGGYSTIASAGTTRRGSPDSKSPLASATASHVGGVEGEMVKGGQKLEGAAVARASARTPESPPKAFGPAQAVKSPVAVTASTAKDTGVATGKAQSPLRASAPAAPTLAAPAVTTPKPFGSGFSTGGFGAFSSSTSSPFSAAPPSSASVFALTTSTGASAFSAFATAPTSFSSFSGSASVGTATGGIGFGQLLRGKKVETKKEKGEGEGDEGDEEGEEGGETGADEGNGWHAEDSAGPKIVLPEVEVSTGEEEEDTLFSTRARLYGMDGGAREWRERGVGVVRVNQRRGGGPARIVMRQDAVLRVLLNAPLHKGMPIEVVDGRFVRFAAAEVGETSSTEGDGKGEIKVATFLLRTPNPATAAVMLTKCGQFVK